MPVASLRRITSRIFSARFWQRSSSRPAPGKSHHQPQLEDPMRNLIIAILSIGITATWPSIAQAQFGSGIVFDPTQSGHAVVQIEHEEQSISNQMQQIENGQQIFTNTVKIAATALQTYNQIVQQYNLYHEMMIAPQMLYSRFLSPTTDLRMLQQISNTYGNSAGWVNSANTGSGALASYQQ